MVHIDDMSIESIKAHLRRLEEQEDDTKYLIELLVDHQWKPSMFRSFATFEYLSDRFKFLGDDLEYSYFLSEDTLYRAKEVKLGD